MKKSVEREIKRWLLESERVVIVGVGSPIRMDDSVGLRVVRDLRGKVSNKVLLIECEVIPETYIQQIIDFKPTHILLIDAAILGLKPGDVKIAEIKRLEISPVYSTHFLPLRIFCEYASKMTKAKILLLLVQPKRTDYGEELTPEVLSSEKKIVNLLFTLLNS